MGLLYHFYGVSKLIFRQKYPRYGQGPSENFCSSVRGRKFYKYEDVGLKVKSVPLQGW